MSPMPFRPTPLSSRRWATLSVRCRRAPKAIDFVPRAAGSRTKPNQGVSGAMRIKGTANRERLTGGAGIDAADYTGSDSAVTILLKADPLQPTIGAGGWAANDT